VEADVVAGEPDEEVAADDPPVDEELEELLPRLLLLHATPTSARTTSALNPRNHRRL